MVAVSDFSGLTSCSCALARAAAKAATELLDCCTGSLRIQDIEAHGARFRALCSHPMPDCLLRVLGDEVLELGLCPLMIEKCRAGVAEKCSELCPGIR